MTPEHKDIRVARLILLISGGILIYWIYRLITVLVRWLGHFKFQAAGGWSALGNFCWANLSIILVVYVIICLQIAGVVEFRFRRNFLKAFFLGLLMTPPIMVIYMKKTKRYEIPVINDK